MRRLKKLVWVHKYSCVQRHICIHVYICDLIQTELVDHLQVAWSCCELLPSNPEVIRLKMKQDVGLIMTEF